MKTYQEKTHFVFLKVVLMVALVSGPFVFCNGEKDNSVLECRKIESPHPLSGRPYFFRTWIRGTPVKPKCVLTTKEAQDLLSNDSTYYEAYFNEGRFLIRLIKHFRNGPSSETKYFYENGKVVKTIVDNGHSVTEKTEGNFQRRIKKFTDSDPIRNKKSGSIEK